MREFVLTAAPDQEFTTILNLQRCTLRFRWNVWVGRWMFDLRIGSRDAVLGRRVVLGVDLIEPFGLGIGGIFAADYEGKGAMPGRTEIAERRIRLFHIDPAEIEALRA